MAHGLGWRGGYSVISVLQFTLTAALFITLPLWKKSRKQRKQCKQWK